MLLRLAAIFLLAFTGAAAAQDIARHFVLSAPPKPMPAFIFEDERGATHDLKEFRGHYVLLNIWATWCGPCVEEMPGINALPEKFDKDTLTVIALNEDRNGDTAAKIFYVRHDYKNLPIYYDASGQILWTLHVTGMPTTILIDPQGKEIGRVEGAADWASKDATDFIRGKIGR